MGFSRPVYWSGLPLPSPTQGLCNLNSLQPRGLYISCQAPLTMGFSRQEYWNGLPFPSPGNLPNPGIKHWSPALAGRFFTINLEYFLFQLYFDEHYNIYFSQFSEKAMAPHSSTLAWKIPWTEELGRLQSMGSLRVRHD